MSFFIKINGWSGHDTEGTTDRLARVFRMNREEAHRTLRDIMEGQTWQFQWTVADHQAETARSYLTRLGFDLELIHAEQSFGPRSRPPVETLVYEEPPKKKSWLDFFKGKPKAPDTPAETIEPEEPAPEKSPRKSLFGFLTKKI